MNIRKVTWSSFWLGVVFAFAHVWGFAAICLGLWLVLWVGRHWLFGRR